MNKDQRIRDPVHNLIAFSSSYDDDKLIWELLGTPAVQRLRRIKQLGFSEFVYPGATHTRFSHVLGAMQMARRMLAVFERNQVFDPRDHERKRRATLAAALLHDIGHGPYSHVFEEISATLKLKKDHETYTEELIAHSEVSDILKKFGCFEDVQKFFSEEPGSDPYSAIISSQMDCDRLDFLVRDRYHTGLQSAIIDLEWLFDSLRIEKISMDVKSDAQQYAFVVQQKGITVTEEFVLSYLKMYQNVYFHKATRAIQYMAKDIVHDVVTKFNDKASTKTHPIVRFFLGKAEKLEDYMRLDDASITSLIHLASESDFGETSILAKRYLRRDIYKGFDLPVAADGNVAPNYVMNFRKALQEKGIKFEIDIVPQKSYKQYGVMEDNFVKNILVKQGGENVALAAISESVRQIPKKKARIYFSDDARRTDAKRILQECRPIDH